MRLIEFVHPTQKQVDTSSEEIDAQSSLVSNVVEAPAVNERRRSLKLRKDAHGVVPQIAILARRYGADLPGMPIDEMEGKFALTLRLRPLLQKVGQYLHILGDVIFVAESEVWQTATTTYKVLRRMALTNAALKADLAPVEAFFALGSRKTKAPSAGASVTPALVTPAPTVHITAPTVNVSIPPVTNGAATALNGHG